MSHYFSLQCCYYGWRVMSKYLVWNTSSSLRNPLETMFLSLSSLRPGTPHRERSEIRICTVDRLSIAGSQSNVLNLKGLLFLFTHRLILSLLFRSQRTSGILVYVAIIQTTTSLRGCNKDLGDLYTFSLSKYLCLGCNGLKILFIIIGNL